MAEKLNLVKKFYVKSQYEKVIDTKFSQLATSVSTDTTSTTTSPFIDNSINEFFQQYEQLFFQIPKFGQSNSHEYLINNSSAYIDFTPVNDDIQALIDEINSLQQQNLELNQQLIELQVSSSQG